MCLRSSLRYEVEARGRLKTNMVSLRECSRVLVRIISESAWLSLACEDAICYKLQSETAFLS